MGADEFAGLTATTDMRTSKLNARQKDHVRELRRKGGSKCSKRTMALQGRQRALDPLDSSLYTVGTKFLKSFQKSDGTMKLYQGTVIGITKRKHLDWLKVRYPADEDEEEDGEEINARDFHDLILLHGRSDMAVDGTGGEGGTTNLSHAPDAPDALGVDGAKGTMPVSDHSQLSSKNLCWYTKRRKAK